jgi:hypothetical protein
MHRIFVVLLVVVVALFASAGCSDDDSGGGDCTSLCTQAQAGSCTSITGNCGNFCTALAAVNGPASCASQYSAYISCLNTGVTVCANSCDGQESALSTCVGTYCAGHMTDANCATLIASF